MVAVDKELEPIEMKNNSRCQLFSFYFRRCTCELRLSLKRCLRKSCPAHQNAVEPKMWVYGIIDDAPAPSSPEGSKSRFPDLLP